MANPEHLAILNQGVEVWNNWRNEYPGIDPDLSNSQFQNINLRNAKLNRDTDLQKSDLTSAVCYLADFSSANLNAAILPNANFRQANLVGANFSNAEITGTSLYGTAREDWIIDGVKCDYVYWDCDSENRVSVNIGEAIAAIFARRPGTAALAGGV